MPLFGPAASGGSGTVTSVQVAAPAPLSSSGGPVTTSGTMTLAWASGQTANRVLASPDGTTGAVALRALVAGDVAAVNPSALTGSGTVPLAALSGITTSQLDAAAAITSAQIAALATSKLTGTIGASQLAVSSPTSGQVGGLATGNLSATAGILGSQLDAAAAIASGQITGLAASKITGTNTLPDGVLSTNVPLLNASNVFTTAGSSASSGTAILQQIAPTVSQSSTAGYTALDVNVTESSTGSGSKNLLNLRVGTTSKFSVANNGVLTTTSDINMASGTQFKTGNMLLANSGNSVQVKSTGNCTITTGVFQLMSDNVATHGMSASSGTQSWLNVAAVANQSGTAGYAALLVNSTETATGSGSKLLADFQVGGTSKASIDNTGALALSPATTTSAPANGGGGALPANATGFATVTINGTARQIAYW